jgi:nucleotide-binding universal stress UspA family protein
MLRRVKTLLVPVDETELSERAVPIAGAMAEALDGEVVLLTVESAHGERGPSEMYLQSLHERVPGGTVVTDLVIGADDTADDPIVREAYDRPKPLVVMATHARTSAGALLLGSTAEKVVRAAPCPVVLVGPRCSTAWAPGTVVVAVDGSPATARVLDVAADWAAVCDVPLAVVHVLTPIALEGGSVVEGTPGLAAACEETLTRAGACCSAHTLESSSASDAIVRWATERGASLIIVGSEHRGRFERALFGSVSMAVVRHADCPVVVVGAPAQR